MSEWIPVGERLPETFPQDGVDEFGSAIVLAHWPNGWIGTAQYWEGEGWYWVEQDDAQQSDADPTHWMSLPTSPECPA